MPAEDGAPSAYGSSAANRLPAEFTMITIKQLRVLKNDRTICCVPDLVVASGERVAIRGANGSGKSTLLRVVAGLEKNYQGSCSVSASQRDRVFVQQSPLLFRGSVAFNVMYGLRARGLSHHESESRAKRWLEQVGLSDLANSRVTHLSGGEKKRVALARALILEPRLALLDEPLADLDTEGAAAVAAALDQLPECTILIATPTNLPDQLTSSEFQILASPDGQI